MKKVALKHLILKLSILGGIVFLFFQFYSSYNSYNSETSTILSHEVDLEKEELHFFLKDVQENRFKSLGRLKNSLNKEEKKLVFAMNGGMFDKAFTPVGLYIEKGKELSPIDLKEEGYGNFYLQPNGIFAITNQSKAVICPTTDFNKKATYQYATQSGPMLVINGTIHPKFNAPSTNVNIRNGVGLLPNGHLLFAMSQSKINFYDFADFFLKKGCQNALYLDGFVSKTYLPSKNSLEEGGNFGIIIGQFKTKDS